MHVAPPALPAPSSNAPVPRRAAAPWQQVEADVNDPSNVRFSHGVCPECVQTVLKPELDELRRTRAARSPSRPPDFT